MPEVYGALIGAAARKSYRRSESLIFGMFGLDNII